VDLIAGEPGTLARHVPIAALNRARWLGDAWPLLSCSCRALTVRSGSGRNQVLDGSR